MTVLYIEHLSGPHRPTVIRVRNVCDTASGLKGRFELDRLILIPHCDHLLPRPNTSTLALLCKASFLQHIAMLIINSSGSNEGENVGERVGVEQSGVCEGE